MLRRLVNDIYEVMWPEVCAGCGRRLRSPKEHLVCATCLTEIPKVSYYTEDINPVTDLFFIEKVKIGYGCCYIDFRKGEWIQQLMHNTKYTELPRLAVKLGRIAAADLLKHDRYTDAEVIVPVPMHDDKVKDRGYNQAERIARGMSEVMGIPVRDDVLRKTVNSTTQAFMNIDERIANAQKIFTAQRVGEIAHCHILLVDDVYTTGSTLLVCTQKILAVMPECRVSVFALAKA